MTKFTFALAAMAAALASASGASAQNGPPPPPPGMDGDKPMTFAEFQARAAEGFDRIDANHDGAIDRSDREAMRGRMGRGPMAGMDHGPDGPPPPPPGAGGPGHDGPMGGPPEGRPRLGRGMGPVMMLLRGADTNHDGKITRAEFDAAVKMHFDAMDTNHDGTVSPEERKVARDKMREEMRARMQERGMNMGDMPRGPGHGPDRGGDGDDMPPPAQ